MAEGIGYLIPPLRILEDPSENEEKLWRMIAMARRAIQGDGGPLNGWGYTSGCDGSPAQPMQPGQLLMFGCNGQITTDDSCTIFVDFINKRVGVNTCAPQYTLDVYSLECGSNVQAWHNGGDIDLDFFPQASGSVVNRIRGSRYSTDTFTESPGRLQFYTNDLTTPTPVLKERLRLDQFGADIRTGFSLSGVVSPAQITGQQDNYSPTGFEEASVVRLTSNASQNVTGLNTKFGIYNGVTKTLLNIGSQNIVLVNESASSFAENRFAFTGAANVTLTPGSSFIVWYDNTTQRWRGSGGTAGGISGAGSAGQVTFWAASGLTGENFFFYDSTNKRLAISSNTALTTPQAYLHLRRTSVFGSNSMIRLDTDSAFGGPNQLNFEWADQGVLQWAFYKPTDNSMRIFNYQMGLGQDALSINGSNNNISITNSVAAGGNIASGTTTPQTPRFFARGSNNSDSFIHIEDSGSAVQYRDGVQNGTAFGFIQTVTNHPLRFYTNSVFQWELNTSGTLTGQKSGGNTIIGGVAASDKLFLQSSSNATRGDIQTDCADVTHVSGSKFRMAGQNRFRYLVSAAEVVQSANQTGLTLAAWTTLNWGSEEWDTDTIHDNVTNNSRLTAKIAGKYLVIAQATFDLTNTVSPSLCGLRIIKNGATTTIYGEHLQPSVQPSVVCASVFMDLAANDYVEAQTLANGSSGTYDITSPTAGTSRFGMAYIGE